MTYKAIHYDITDFQNGQPLAAVIPKVKPLTKPIVAQDNILLSDSVTVALTMLAWVLWGINGTRDWGKDGLKDAIIIGSGLQLAYSTFSLINPTTSE